MIILITDTKFTWPDNLTTEHMLRPLRHCAAAADNVEEYWYITNKASV